jgi:hypothetical protein
MERQPASNSELFWGIGIAAALLFLSGVFVESVAV